MLKRGKPNWKRFEEAVAQFLRALAPGARVLDDVELPDPETGFPRQRDVWIDAALGGHIPIKILVSCKRTGRRLSQQDIDAFWGELNSSRAHKGVIYAFSGFTKQAVAKAKAKGISCCRLYQREPADLPESLVLNVYLTSPQAGLASAPSGVSSPMTWSDLFQLQWKDGGKTLLDATAEKYRELEEQGRKELDRGSTLPSVKRAKVEFMQEDGVRFSIILFLRWRRFRAKVEAVLLDGSYEIIERNFKGQQWSPVVSLKDAHPGPGWEEVPAEEEVVSPALMMILYGQNIRDGLQDLASQRVFPDKAADVNEGATSEGK